MLFKQKVATKRGRGADSKKERRWKEAQASSVSGGPQVSHAGAEEEAAPEDEVPMFASCREPRPKADS